MATASMATAAGAAALLYYTLNRKLQSNPSREGEEEGENGGGVEVTKSVTVVSNRVSLGRPIQAPATWLETISTLSETLRFTYSETLGKCLIGDLVFGINFLLKRQGHLHVANVFGGKDSLQLKGSEGLVELRLLLRLLTLCWHFSKKPFPLFLEETGLCQEDVLLQEPKAGIVGHSLGGGTAAVLTYVMCEQQEFSTATCVSFAPAACMTWELAESGNNFVTSVINGADLVPTFSTASADDLRTEVVMKTSQNVAQAAWRSPSMKLSSWSCMGARHRRTTICSNSKEDVDSTEPLSTTTTEHDESFLISQETKIRNDTEEFPVSTSEGVEWSTELQTGYSCPDDSEGEDLMGHGRNEDRMTELELWEQLEQELYEQTEVQEEEEEEAEIVEETREQEETAIAKASEMVPESSIPDIKESHRFFPPGKIMHIVTLPVEPENEGHADGGNSTDTSGVSTRGKVTIFVTPRSLYSKLRLSRRMISDHLMPVYRRHIEQLIFELEEELSSNASIDGASD